MHLQGINIPETRIAALCCAAGVRRLWLFGSILRDDFRPDSDIDVLVETDPTDPPGIFALGGLQMDLSDLLGRFVHLTTLAGVPPEAQDRLLASARLQYAA